MKLKRINIKDENVSVEGIYRFNETGKFRRYTDEIVEKYPRLKDPDNKCAGARVRFRTNSGTIRVEIKLSNQYVDRGMSFYQANAAYAFRGSYPRSEYVSLLSADDAYDSDTVFAEFRNGSMEDITVFLPRNPTVEDVNVFIEDGAVIEPPTPHIVPLPFVFYGSSITEQGHTSTFMAYPSLLSRFFDADFYNFGASGNARGEPEIAQYLGKIPKSVFFYDYDHNAPSAEHLLETHESFFRVFRRYDPDTPVIMTSRPSDDDRETAYRAEIVERTCKNAVSAGDKNVYFIDGLSLFGGADPALCTTDRTHPNDLGHYLMANTVAGFIEKNKILKRADAYNKG